MFISSAMQPLTRGLRRSEADDAYMAWCNAHQQCTDALRAWNAAGTGARTAAYRAYAIELELEDMAAEALERVHRRRRAASERSG